MTQAYVAPWILYTASGLTDTFAYPWRIGAATDLQVFVQGVLASAYTVTGVGGAGGGSVVFTTAPAATAIILIRRVTPQTQLVDYQSADAFPAETHEAALDKLTRLVQDLEERFSRLPMLPHTALGAERYPLLPRPGAGMLVGWNAAGTDLALYAMPQVTINTQHPDLLLSDFGAAGDGVTDDSGALQAACDQAAATGRRLYIPPVPVGYRLNTPLNLTDLQGRLTLVGAGMEGMANGLAISGPQGGSVLLGNTGIGMPILDLCGSNNILLEHLTLSTFGMPTPSQVGVLMGGSTTSPLPGYPGGGNQSLHHVSIAMVDMPVGGSIPVYAPNAGLQTFVNCWTLGNYGLYFTSNNELGLSSPYVTFVGPTFINAGVAATGCSLLGYGTHPVLQIEGASSMTFDQLYTVTIRNGPAYTGQPFSVRLKDCTDIRINIENDYWPCVLYAEGALTNVHLRGVHFPGTTPIPALVGVVASLYVSTMQHCSFRVFPAMGGVANYFYTTQAGVDPPLQFMYDCAFLVDSLSNSQTAWAYFNADNLHPTPFFNLRFDGDKAADVSPAGYIFLVDGAAPADTAWRVFINGVLSGTG